MKAQYGNASLQNGASSVTVSGSGIPSSDTSVDCSSWTHRDGKWPSDGEWHSRTSGHQSPYHPSCALVPQNVCKVGVLVAHSTTETMCWCLWSRKWWLPRQNRYYHQAETKRASKEWRRRTQPSAGKDMLPLFRDEQGVILEHYSPRRNTVTSATYTGLLGNHLRPAIEFKRRGLQSTGVLLQHKILGPILPLQRLLPSRTCTSSVFHIRRTHQTSPPAITTYRITQTSDDEEVQKVVHEWLRTRPKDFF
jgi:hypothetical protein